MPSEAEHREQAAFDARTAEQDELRALRAENERLARAFADSEAACLIQVRMLRAENERLRTLIKAYLENDSNPNWDALADAVLGSDKAG